MPGIEVFDVVILGSGPAGLQAAIHAARRKVSVLLLGRIQKSSLWWAHVDNFCCIFNLSGEDMLRSGRDQAVRFGVEAVEEDALKLARSGRHFLVETESGRQAAARSVIVATGTTRNTLGVPGEKELLGRGVSYCVDCDGGFFRGEDVAVVGGQSAAAGGAITLSAIARSVHLVCDTLEVSPALRGRILAAGVVLVEQAAVKAVQGAGKVEGLVLADGTRLAVSGVFIELGAKGVLELAVTLGLELDEGMKYVRTDKRQRTNVAGIFAAGDICGPPLQMAKAVGEGCVAGIEAAAYARKLKGEEEASGGG
jgi:thioredoxin reductase (NADPH)